MLKLPKRKVHSYTGTLVHSLTRTLVIIAFVLPTFYILNSIFVRPASAANFDLNLGDFHLGLGEDEYNKEQFDFQSLVGVGGSLITMLGGCPSAGCPAELKQQGSAIQKLGDTIASLYAIPSASGVYYASNVIQRLNPVKPAYAQTPGVGFQVLVPFLEIWKAVRNIVYVLFAIGAVILGFSVMFRTKISPQASMTIQVAIPRIVVGLLLVTFSYAIVGFMIDLTYVFMGVLFWGLGANKNLVGYDAATSFNDYINAGFHETVATIIGLGLGGSVDVATALITSDPLVSGGVALGGILGAFLGFLIAPSLPVLLIPLVLGLVIAFLGFLIKTLFALAKAYLMLLFHLVAGPFLIFWATLTGGSVYKDWLRGVLANLLVFPVVGLLIFLADLFIKQINYGVANSVTPYWAPPYLGRQHGIITGMIALGTAIILPQVPEFINYFLDVRGPRREPSGFGRHFAGLPGGFASAYEQERWPEGKEKKPRSPWATFKYRLGLPERGTGKGTAQRR